MNALYAGKAAEAEMEVAARRAQNFYWGPAKAATTASLEMGVEAEDAGNLWKFG